MHTILYADVARVLDAAVAELPAAEAHGCLCGALCADDTYSLDRWLAECVPDPAEVESLAQSGSLVRRLFDATVESLHGESMEFEPLLPDDDAALTQRTEALAQWAQGFLYGLASGDLGRRTPLSVDTNEILRDFAEIGRAAATAGTGEEAGAGADPIESEADEAAYAELHEYVRVGVQLIHDELLSLRRNGSRPRKHGNG